MPIESSHDKPDAVIIPLDYAPGYTGIRLMQKIQADFGPIFGTKRVHIRAIPEGRFIWGFDPKKPANNGECQPCYPVPHFKAGEPCYDWVDKDNSIQYGYLMKEDPDASV